MAIVCCGPRRKGSLAEKGRQSGSTRSQMPKSSAGRFHDICPSDVGR